MDPTLFLIALGIWNLILSWLIWRTILHYRRLTKKVKKGNLERILESILKEGELTKMALDNLGKRIRSLDLESKFCFQKAGLVKFNPFSELGGDQSFSLAILDSQNQGLVVTSLHGRQTTRIYTKLVGEKEVKFSEEELKAIKKAKKEKK